MMTLTSGWAASRRTTRKHPSLRVGSTVGVDADADAVIGDSASTGGRRHSVVAVSGLAARRLALVAEDARHVGGAAGPFGEPQHEVVVVGAVVAVAEAVRRRRRRRGG